MVPGHSPSGGAEPRTSRVRRRLQPGLVRSAVDAGQKRDGGAFRGHSAARVRLARASRPRRLRWPTKSALELRQFPEEDAFGRRLALAARAFVVRRGAGRTVIAGYPWFLDWGRDTFISARGLLAAGMVSEVAELLVTFGRFRAGRPHAQHHPRRGRLESRHFRRAALVWRVVRGSGGATGENLI